MILQPQVVALGLLLLQTGAVFPNQVNTMVGESVTLPCSYLVRNKIVLPICWGRGPCPSSQCSNTLIKTDGHRVTYQKDSRYWLHGKISQGDVSFTIENVTVDDSGQYCCHIEVLGWFSLIKNIVHLSVMPAGTTSVPTSASVSTSAPLTPEQTQSNKIESTLLVPTQAVGTQHTTLQETKTLPVTSTLDSWPTDGNGTVTQSEGGLNNQSVFPARNRWAIPNWVYIGLASFLIIVVIIIKNYFNSRERRKIPSRVLETHPQNQVLQL